MFSKLVEIVEKMTRAGHSLGIYLASLLIFRLGYARKHSLAMKIFNLLPDNHKCSATYTALISVYFSVRRVNEALEIHKIMCSKEFCPVLGTYDGLLTSLERNGKYAEAEHYRKAKKIKSLLANSGSQERLVAITGDAVQWLRDSLGIISSASKIEEMALQVESTGGVYFVPAFNGLFAPWWREDARSICIGITRFTSKAHIARATLESMCFQVKDVLDSMHKDSGESESRKKFLLRVDDGAAINNLLMQI
ncbi:hypothetical protein JHK87_000703 [Glycine soja]|nr:hypothetical protein JHK87_000703 [Glycine soja]